MGFDMLKRLLFTGDIMDTSWDAHCYDEDYENMTDTFERYIDEQNSTTVSQELFNDNFNDQE